MLTGSNPRPWLVAVCFRGLAHYGRAEPGPARGPPAPMNAGKAGKRQSGAGGDQRGSGSRSQGELVSKGQVFEHGEISPVAHACAGNSADPSNELLGLSHDQRLDTGTTGAAGGADPQLETVGAVQRSEN